jgi:hypothetical protein
MMKPQYLVEIAGKGFFFDAARRKCSDASASLGAAPAGYERRLVVGSTLCGGEWDEGLAQFSQGQRSSATLWQLTSYCNAAAGSENSTRAEHSDSPEPQEPRSVT